MDNNRRTVGISNIKHFERKFSLRGILLVIWMVGVTFVATAQTPGLNYQQFNDSQFGKSAFNNNVGFTAKSSCFLNIEYKLANVSKVLDKRTACKLFVKADPDEVYDVADKVYDIAAGDVKIVYVEYAHSNCLQMYIGKDKYELTYIDGDCWNCIPNLVFAYSTTAKFVCYRFHNFKR